MKKILTILFTILMVLCLSACGNKTEEVEEPLVDELPAVADTYETFVAKNVDEEVELYMSVQDHESWWDNKVTIYAQDDNGGYLVYEGAADEEMAKALTPGTLIRVKGYKAEWSGEVEITDAIIEPIAGAYEGKVYDPEDLTDLLGNNDELAKHMNKKASFKNLTVVNYTYNWDGSGTRDDSDIYLNVTDEKGNAVAFVVRKYLTGPDTDLFKAVEALSEGDVIDVDTYLYWYEGPQARIYNFTKH